MTGDSALGRYCNTDSLLHRTDPRVKIILYVFYLVAIFMLSNPISLLMLAAVTLLLI